MYRRTFSFFARTARLTAPIILYSLCSPLPSAHAEIPSVPQPIHLAHVEHDVDPRHTEEVELTLFDLYLGETYRGLVPVSYTSRWFQIENPQHVLEQIPSVRHPQELIAMLSGRLTRNHALPGIGEVRFSEETFRIMLDLPESQLFSSKLELGERLPDPEEKLSFRNDLGVAYSGNMEDRSDAAFSHRIIAGYGKWWSEIEGAALKDADYELNTAALHGIYGDSELSSGLQRTLGHAFAGSVEFTGLTYGTKEELFSDDEALRGSRLEVYVPSPARVEFFRGERLIGVQLLDFGLQEVDTRRFPHGSYEIEIVITEDNGQVTREQRFFTKSGLLGFRDRPQWKAQLGFVRDEVDLTDIPVYQLELSRRLGSFLQSELSVAGSDDLTLGYVGLSGLYLNLYGRGGFSFSDEGNYGVSSYVGLSYSPFSLTVNYRGTLNVEEQAEGDLSPALDESDPRFDELSVEDRFRYRLNGLARKMRDLKATLSMRYKIANLQLSASLSDYEGQTKRYAYGPRLDLQLYRHRRHDVRLDLAYFDTERGTDASALLRYRYNLYPWIVETESSVLNRGNGKDERNLRQTVSFDDVDRSGLGLRGKASATVRDVNGENGLGTLGSVGVNYIHKRAELEGFLNSTEIDRNRDNAWGLNARSSFIVGGDKELSISYPSRMEAGVLIDLVSSTAQTEIDILINNQVYTRIPAGTKVLVGLNPYAQYEVRIRPATEDELIYYDTEPVHVVLFPGNIAHQRWEIEKVYIGLGRIVDSSGAPIPHQRLNGALGFVVTESDGSFQAEVSGEEQFIISGHGKTCTVRLPKIKPPRHFYDYGKLPCIEDPEVLPLKRQ